jgi:hypothetical protein
MHLPCARCAARTTYWRWAGELQPELPDTAPLGILTTQNRDAWAKDRAELVATPKNAASLELVDSALFALCLDDEVRV